MTVTHPPPPEGTLPKYRFTNAEVRRMVDAGIFEDTERVELIRGELVPMGSEGDAHGRARMLLSRIFFQALSPHWFVASNLSLFLADDIEVQPDLHVFPQAMNSEDVRGPDVLLAIELSHTTQYRDLKVKAPIYAHHGVRELWVIDLDTRTGLVFDRIENGAYMPGRAVGGEDLLTPDLIEGVSLRIRDLF